MFQILFCFIYGRNGKNMLEYKRKSCSQYFINQNGEEIGRNEEKK